MSKLVLEGRGGESLDPREMLSDELIGMVEGLNPGLGKPGDPYESEFAAFRDEMNNMGIVLIDAELMTVAKFDDIDFTNKEQDTKEIPEDAFVFGDFEVVPEDKVTPNLNNILLLSLLFSMPTESPIVDGYVFGGGFITPLGDVVPDDFNYAAKK